MYYKILCFAKRTTILIQTNCMFYDVVYSKEYCDCVHVAFKCVLKFLKTFVYFTRLQEEKDFCSKEMFTYRKLTDDDTLLSVSILFQLNETTDICTANREHSDHYGDCVSHPNTHTHSHTHTHTHSHPHTHTHAYIYIYFFLEIVTGIIEEFSFSANWNCRKQVPKVKICSRAQKTTRFNYVVVRERTLCKLQ
jgi:hypothetical protein